MYSALLVFVPSEPKPISRDSQSTVKLALLMAQSKDDLSPFAPASSGCSSASISHLGFPWSHVFITYTFFLSIVFALDEPSNKMLKYSLSPMFNGSVMCSAMMDLER